MNIKIALLLILIFLLFLLLIGIPCESDYPMQLGNDYFIDYGANSEFIITNTNNGIQISDKIVAWNSDSTFIIAKQKPSDSVNKIIYKEHPNIKIDKYQELYHKSKVYNYWIIDKREELLWDTINKRHTGSVKGPFTYEEYLEKRRELSVPDSLKLKKTEEWLK